MYIKDNPFLATCKIPLTPQITPFFHKKKGHKGMPYASLMVSAAVMLRPFGYRSG